MLYKLYCSLPAAVQRFVKKRYYDVIWTFFKFRYLMKYRTTDFFHHIDIEISSACNRRCKYCPNYKYDRGLIKNQKLMPEKTFKKIIDELAEINYSGMVTPSVFNEPLLDKRVIKLLKYTREKLPKSKILIVSNGDYLTPKLYQEFLDIRVSEFLITEHGTSMTKNMKDTFNYIKKNNVRNIIVYRKFTEDTPLYNRAGMIEHKTIIPEAPCSYPLSPIVVDHKGNVVLCCNDYFAAHVYGNVNKERLVDIWNKPNYKQLRVEIQKQIFKLPICKKCVGIEK